MSENIKYLEKKYKVNINLKIDNQLIIPDYKVEFKNKSKKIINVIEEISKLEYSVYNDNNLPKKIAKKYYKRKV